jgi:LacI family transcriptional regulator
MFIMKTVLYFQSRQNINAGEKLGGVRRIAVQLGWHVQIVERLPSRKRLIALLDFWQPIGAIIECGGTSVTVDPKIFGTLPVVFLDHDPSSLPKDAFCVAHDSAATGMMAAQELLRYGVRKFAFVPYPECRFWSRERERGFVSALSLNGHSCNVFRERHSVGDSTRYHRELRKFIASLPKPCALFAANDQTAAEVLTAAAFAGIKVPDELSVIGVDDFADICEHTEPTLSSVKPDFHRGGSIAALLLDARLRDMSKYSGPRYRTFGPLQVTPRASTRKLAAHDHAVAGALELIRREACSGLTAKEVLKHFPCSRRQAEMRFRKATGRSILNEIHAVRLEFAKQLLSEGGLPLKTISDFCGFDHANSLRKFFKKQTGKTMSEWKDTRPSNTFR